MQKPTVAELRKQQLIDAAKVLFISKGYNDVTIKDILEKVNGARGMFYYYFKDKEDIYKSVVNQITEELLESRLAFFDDPSLSFLDKVDCLIDQCIVQYEKIWTAIAEGIRLDYEKDIASKMMDALSDHITLFLEEALEKGEIRETNYLNKDNCLQMIRFIIFGFSGVMDHEQAQKNSQLMRESGDFIKNYIRVLLVNK